MTLASGQRARARSRPPDGRTRRARRRGQALVELAIILPVLLFLLLGALDLGRVFYANITVANAAKEAALRASEGHADGDAAAQTEASGASLTIDPSDVTIVFSDATNECSDTTAFGSTVTATVDAPFTAITPYVGAMIGGQTITLTSASTAHCAVLPESGPSATPTPTPGATPTPTPGATPTPTPGATPTPTPTPAPTPTATPTPTPTPTPMCTVPQFVGTKKNNAAGTWTGAGFTGGITYSPSPNNGNWTIQSQSLGAGSSQPCLSGITVGG